MLIVDGYYRLYILIRKRWIISRVEGIAVENPDHRPPRFPPIAPRKFRKTILDPTKSDPSPMYRNGSRIRLNRALQCPQSRLRCLQTSAFSSSNIRTQQNRVGNVPFWKIKFDSAGRPAVSQSFPFLGPSEISRLQRLKRSKLKP